MLEFQGRAKAWRTDGETPAPQSERAAVAGNELDEIGLAVDLDFDRKGPWPPAPRAYRYRSAAGHIAATNDETLAPVLPQSTKPNSWATKSA
jgi:hypothetical protein